MKIYIDFDGVIFDTEDALFDDYKKLKVLGIEIDRLVYLQNRNWEEILSKSEVINNSIEMLKELKEAAILGKIYSMENEAVAKIKKLRNLGITNEIILSPYLVKKSDMVSACGNILVDNTIHNLDDWQLNGGISIFFNKNNEDVDGWGDINTKYPKIKSLEQLKQI